MAPTKYRVKSEKTRYYPVTAGEVSGGIVNTENGAHDVPRDSILTFSEPVHDKNVKVTIAGTKGLYVALPPGATEGTRVIWAEKPFEWQVIPTIATGGKITYQFIPADGADLYAYDDFDIGRFLVVKPGNKIVAPQSYFTITSA